MIASSCSCLNKILGFKAPVSYGFFIFPFSVDSVNALGGGGGGGGVRIFLTQRP